MFNDDLNFRGKLWMKVKGDSCLVLRMTVWIKGILEFLGEVMDGVKGGIPDFAGMTKLKLKHF